MPSILETLRGRLTRHDSSGGGLLSGLGGSGGMLSTHIGVLQTRLATAQAATGGPMAKIQAVLGNQSTGLGAHLKAGGLLSGFGGSSGSSGGSSTDSTRYQVAGGARVYGNPSPPAGIKFR
jgi:hypothetical protein